LKEKKNRKANQLDMGPERCLHQASKSLWPHVM